MKKIVVDYRPGMCGFTSIPVYEFADDMQVPQSYAISNEWEALKDALVTLCYAHENFDLVFYGTPKTLPFSLDELKKEFMDYEHKKYCNGANIEVSIVNA